MMCSSCGRCMAETLFNGPDFPRVQNAGKRGVLAQAARDFIIRSQYRADFLQRALQQFAPFRVATDQCGCIGILFGPAGQIVVSELQQAGLLPQARDGATAQFQTDLVYQFMTHAGKLAGWPEGVNAARAATRPNGLTIMQDCHDGRSDGQ